MRLFHLTIVKILLVAIAYCLIGCLDFCDYGFALGVP